MSENIAYGIIGVFVAKEIIALVLKAFFNKTSEHIKAINDNTVAIIKLETKFEMVFQQLAKIQKIEQDVHEAHARIREMRAQN